MVTTTAQSRFGKGKRGVPSEKRRIYTASLVILLLTSAGINVLLTRQIRDLRTTIRMLKQEIAAAESLQNGRVFPSIRAQDLSGKPVTLDFFADNRPTILYLFSPQCDWCTRNIDNIKALGGGVGEKYSLMGLSTSDTGLNDYVVEHGFDFPVYAISPSDRNGLRTGTPRTLIISTDREIVENWFGAYDGGLQKKLEEFFQVALPGLTGDREANADGDKRGCG